MVIKSYHVVRLRRRGGQRLVGLPGHELGQLGDEVGQAENARGIELPRLLDQLVQIGQLPRPQEFGHQQRVIAGTGHRPVRINCAIGTLSFIPRSCLSTAAIAINRYLGPEKNGYIVYVNYIATLVSSLGGFGIPATTRKQG